MSVELEFCLLSNIDIASNISLNIVLPTPQNDIVQRVLWMFVMWYKSMTQDSAGLNILRRVHTCTLHAAIPSGVFLFVSSDNVKFKLWQCGQKMTYE